MIYLLRHCEATGQSKDAELTIEGSKSAEHIVKKLNDLNIEEIYCSPMKRAISTIEPFALKNGMSINIDSRLSERVLTSDYLSDFLTSLEMTFNDYDLTFSGGESSREALLRALGLIENLDEKKNVLVVSHGNLIALLLNQFGHFTFNDWKALKNPDLWCIDNETNILRVKMHE